MKKITVKELAEAIGVISIIASLVFVGLQLEQSRDIALSQSAASYNESKIEAFAEINSHIEIWEKGNAGESLSDLDYAVYLNLIDLMNDLYFYQATASLLAVGNDPGPTLFSGNLVNKNSGLSEWAYFLYKNPGAMEALRQVENESQEGRSLDGNEGENLYLKGLTNAIKFYEERDSNK